jgi:type IV pilus assembly protein PilO
MKWNRFTILFLMAAAAGLAGADFLTCARASQERDAALAQILARERAAAELRQATAGLGEVQGKVADLTQAIALIESRLAPERDLDRICKDIWQMADADSLQTQTTLPMNIVPRGNYGEQPVALTFTGDFSAFYAFMVQLERLSRPVRVMHMDLQRLPDPNGAMRAQMTIGIFYRPDSAQPEQASETAAATPP